MEILGLERKFMLKNVSGESVLDDIDPNWTPERIKDHYASVYPELTNAKIVDNGIVDGRHEIMFKTRYSATEVSITTKEGKPLPVNGRDVVIIDDIISSGGTIIEAVKLIQEAGAGKIVVGCTHPVLRGKTPFDSALANIYDSGVSIVVGTDTVPSQVSYVSVADVIAKTIKETL